MWKYLLYYAPASSCRITRRVASASCLEGRCVTELSSSPAAWRLGSRNEGLLRGAHPRLLRDSLAMCSSQRLGFFRHNNYDELRKPTLPWASTNLTRKIKENIK